MDRLVLTFDAQEDAYDLGLKLDDVVSMCRQGAHVTHENGNRRYEGYIIDLDTEESVIYSIRKFHHGGKHADAKNGTGPRVPGGKRSP